MTNWAAPFMGAAFFVVCFVVLLPQYLRETVGSNFHGVGFGNSELIEKYRLMGVMPCPAGPVTSLRSAYVRIALGS